jgi:Mg2+-importing ATPase
LILLKASNALAFMTRRNDKKLSTGMARDVSETYWTLEAGDLLARLETRMEGLPSSEAQRRLLETGPNSTASDSEANVLPLLLRQFGSPLVLVLIFGAGLSFLLRQWTDATIILVIVLASALLGFSQEYRASTALAELKRRLALTARVQRDGVAHDIRAVEIVPGDTVLLSAGNLIPADGIVLTAKDFLVSEALLTGESMPVEKEPGGVAADTPLARRTNCVFSGTSVRSGIATILAVKTGRDTALGDVARRIAAAEPETEFERGVRQFGYLLIRVMLVMVLFVLTVSQALGRPLIDSLLFAVALAVGMTPELLPAIVTVTLSAGARAMAKQGVIVRRLEALENLGSIDVLCTDKTGTLTEGSVTLAAAIDIDGKDGAEIRKLAYLNSAFETGIENPLDQAIVAACEKAGLSAQGFTKIDEIPYDFVRKRLTIVVANDREPGTHLIVTKGTFKSVIAACTRAKIGDAVLPLGETAHQRFEALLKKSGQEGFRVLALAEREVPAQKHYRIEDEQDMTLVGLLLFADPPKPDARQAIADLEALGIRLKVISGDNREVTIHVAQALGLETAHILSGRDIAKMKEEALWHLAEQTDLFVEVDPQQKERIIRALQKRGHAVGYMGDGINDAPALHTADIGISVDQAVDVARQSADIVLLKRDLDVLRLGIESGRRTFANTLKYISITTSANFGNMISMAIATPFLPFLPLLPKQILLNNFLSDVPSVAISTDNVDAEQVRTVERWNIAEVRRFMIVFGLVSSAFDVLTFALLLRVFHADEKTFQTAWFVVSFLTEVAIVLVLRTRAAALHNKPSKLLLATTVLVSVAAVILPGFTPIANLFGFAPIPLLMLIGLFAIVLAYLLATEFAKYWFYRPSRSVSRTTRHKKRPARHLK